VSNLFSTIMIVDDELNTREGLRIFLESKQFDVLLAKDGREALKLVTDEKPDLALIDLRMPDMDGMTLLHRLKDLDASLTVIMLTAYGTVESAVQAMKAGAFHYLTKPVNLDELDLVIKKALNEESLKQENKDLRNDLMNEKFASNHIIGNTSIMSRLLETTRQAAESQASILIQGESGTGKELLAHEIHRLSPRRSKPFVTIHCAALTETLLTSELFGHERGAFTGATERKIGRFERADQGTLFLDEISELSESTQVKLLRFLQSGEMERVGSSKTFHVNVRLICATNRDLKVEVGDGRFREDLYYRVNVILINIPPLRERKEDIPLLVNHYVRQISRMNQKDIKKITPEAMSRFMHYEWPGNIRELRNVVERMIVLAKTDVLDVHNIVQSIGSGIVPRTLRSNSKSEVSIANMERNLIERTLTNLSGNKSMAAKKLGISRRTLYRKLSEYSIGV